MDVFQSLIMVHSYFQSADYLVDQGWIRAMLPHPTSIQQAGPNIQHYTKYLPWVVRYSLVENMIVPCHRIVAVLDILDHLVITTFLVL